MKKTTAAILAGLAVALSYLLVPGAAQADDPFFCLSGWTYDSSQIDVSSMTLTMVYQCNDDGGSTLIIGYLIVR
jgi:hypothetical protein